MEEVSLGLIPIEGDRRFSEDIKKIQLLTESGELFHRVEKIVGKL
jgi:hypothetical protein